MFLNFYRIILKTRRCGGGFGCKICRSNFAACATALVAKILNRPCRMSMSMKSIMRAIGKRPNTKLNYEVNIRRQSNKYLAYKRKM